MIGFPTQREDYAKYLYSSPQFGIIFPTSLVKHLSVDGKGNQTISEHLTFINNNQENFVIPIEEFNGNNFTPLITVDNLRSIVSDGEKIRALVVFSQTFTGSTP